MTLISDPITTYQETSERERVIEAACAVAHIYPEAVQYSLLYICTVQIAAKQPILTRIPMWPILQSIGRHSEEQNK
jgi:hypothetical protein